MGLNQVYNLLLFWFSSGFATICQVTTLVYPGKDPMMFYFCLGKMPKSLIGVKPKSNLSFNVTTLLTLVCHLVTFIHIKYWKHRRHLDFGPTGTNSSSYLQRALKKDRINRFDLWKDLMQTKLIIGVTKLSPELQRLADCNTNSFK